jgi:inner membrane protein
MMGVMEPVTQGLLGATFGQALYGRALGRRAFTWGAVAGMLPDIDVVMNFTGPMGEFLYHRGITHSVWFGPVVGPLLGALAWRRFGREPGKQSAWIGLFVIGLLTHPLLDVFTTYGTQLLTPLSDRRFTLDAVAIVDPAYSVILAASLAIGLWRGVASRESQRVGAMALALSTAYLGYGYWLNEQIKDQVRARLVAEGARGATSAASADVQSYPTLLQLYLRRVVVRLGDEVRVGWVSAWRRNGRETWQSFVAPRDPRIEAARATREGRILEWFAAGQTVGRVVEGPGGKLVEIDDLRYGLPGRAELGFWGIRVPLDDEGRPSGPVERFNRPFPESPGSVLRQIFREAFLS